MEKKGYSIYTMNWYYGVPNWDQSFVKKISNQFGLKKVVRVVHSKIKNKDGSTSPIRYEFIEFQNLKSKLIVSFERNGTKPIGNVLNNIYILSKNKSLLYSVANYFLQHSQAAKAYKQKWAKYLYKMSFERRPIKYFEYGGIPSLRCITHLIQRNRNSAYYLEVSIAN